MPDSEITPGLTQADPLYEISTNSLRILYDWGWASGFDIGGALRGAD